MARLPRLSLPGIVHYVLQRGHNGGAIVHDARDVEQLLQTLRDAALTHGVVLHAYAVTGSGLRLLATPDSAQGVSLAMQALGRRYAAWFNHRHQRTGALWDGRFRSALIESGPPVLRALRHVDAVPGALAPFHDDRSDGLGIALAGTVSGPDIGRTSAEHRTGGRRDAALVDPPEYWQLGNTPFDRESTYRHLLSEALPVADRDALQRAVQGAWALGSDSFLRGLAGSTSRPLTPRARGRPRRAA